MLGAVKAVLTGVERDSGGGGIPVAMITDAFASATNPQGFTADASQIQSATYFAWKAVDFNTGTGWLVSAGALPHWWEIDFVDFYNLSKLSMHCDVPITEDRMPRNFTIQAWNGASWDIIYTGTAVAWFNGETKEFVFAAEKRMSKLRVYVDTTRLSPGGFAGISELMPYGYPD